MLTVDSKHDAEYFLLPLTCSETLNIGIESRDCKSKLSVAALNLVAEAEIAN